MAVIRLIVRVADHRPVIELDALSVQREEPLAAVGTGGQARAIPRLL